MGEMTGEIKGGMKIVKSLYIKAFWEIEGRDGVIFDKLHLMSKMSSTTKIVCQRLLDYSHLGNEMFPRWEQSIPSLGI